MFRELYKQSIKNREELQEDRRKKLLEEQRRRRLQLQDGIRELEVHPRYQPRRGSGVTFSEVYGYEYSLQLSEWLQKRPDDLTDWLLVPCPKGQRCLVVASGGRTEMYSKKGRRRMKFHSLLPGDAVGYKSTTLLDCIYTQEKDSFYVLDALVFGNQELLNCEAQFRFFWLRSKFEEYEGLSECSQQNEKALHLLEQFDFENMERVAVMLQRFPIWLNNSPQLDGFLFYHKEGSYVCGTTPLVGWLFPFMVPDILNLTVSSDYERPAEYTDPLSYMVAFDAQLARKKYKNPKTESMETTFGEINVETTKEGSLQYLLEVERKLEADELDEMSTVNEHDY